MAVVTGGDRDLGALHEVGRHGPDQRLEGEIQLGNDGVRVTMLRADLKNLHDAERVWLRTLLATPDAVRAEILANAHASDALPAAARPEDVRLTTLRFLSTMFVPVDAADLDVLPQLVPGWQIFGTISGTRQLTADIIAGDVVAVRFSAQPKLPV